MTPNTVKTRQHLVRGREKPLRKYLAQKSGGRTNSPLYFQCALRCERFLPARKVTQTQHLVCNHFPDEHKQGGVAAIGTPARPFRIGDELLASSAHDGNQLSGRIGCFFQRAGGKELNALTAAHVLGHEPNEDRKQRCWQHSRALEPIPEKHGDQKSARAGRPATRATIKSVSRKTAHCLA